MKKLLVLLLSSTLCFNGAFMTVRAMDEDPESIEEPTEEINGENEESVSEGQPFEMADSEVTETSLDAHSTAEEDSGESEGKEETLEEPADENNTDTNEEISESDDDQKEDSNQEKDSEAIDDSSVTDPEETVQPSETEIPANEEPAGQQVTPERETMGPEGEAEEPDGETAESDIKEGIGAQETVEQEKRKVTVTFDKNNQEATGTMEDEVFVVGEAKVLFSNAYVLDGYTFVEWNTNSDGSGISYTEAQETAFEKDVILYAIWDETEISEELDEVSEDLQYTYSGRCGVNITWTFDEETGTLRLTGYGSTYDYGFQAPEPYNTGNPWYHTDVRRIIIGEGITRIGNSALNGMHLVTYVQIPNTVETIGDSAFSDNRSITSIKIPESVTSIGSWAFSSCSSLKTITIPDSVKSVPYAMCCECGSLETVTIGKKTTNIELGAFENCEKLSSITLPDSLKSIGKSAFLNNKALSSVKLPGKLTSIGDSAFEGCTSLSSISIPNSVTEISSAAFSGCTTLSTVNLPSSLSAISASAFSGCTNLETIYLPDSITEIKADVFKDCSALKTVHYPSALKSVGKSAFSGCSSLTEVVLPNTVTVIESGAFSRCSSLKSIKLPTTLTGISTSLLEDCELLETVSMGNKITSIGETAFKNCKQLKSIIIPKAVTSIGREAFLDCTKLNDISFPKTLSTIGRDSFKGCRNLENILYESDKASWLKIDFEENSKPVSNYLEYTYNKYPYMYVFDRKKIIATKNETITNGYSVIPEAGKNTKVTWNSSDPAVATVTSSGVIKCISGGTAIITLTSADRVTESFEVVVKDAPGISFHQDDYSVMVYNKIQLQVSCIFEEGDSEELQWSTSDPEIATIDSSGLVEGVSVGTALITVQTSDNKYSNTCQVIVKPEPSDILIDPNPICMRIGEKKHIDISILPENAPQDYRLEYDTASPYVDFDTENNVYGNKRGYLKYLVLAPSDSPIGGDYGYVYVIDPAYEENLALFMKTLKENAEPISKKYSDELYHGTTHAIFNSTEDGLSYVGYCEDNGYICIGMINNVGDGQVDCFFSYDPKSQCVVELNETAYIPGNKHVTGYAIRGKDITESNVSPWNFYDIRISSNVDLTSNQKSTYEYKIQSTLKSWLQTVDTQLRMMPPYLNLRDLGLTSWKTTGTPYVDDVVLNTNTLVLAEGQKATLKATVIPDEGDVNHAVSWYSSDENVVSVDSNGNLVAKGIGSADITVITFESNKKATCHVTVNPYVNVKDFTLKDTNITLPVGKSRKLSYSFTPSDATNKKVTWTSSNTKVATVDANGKVTARGTGSTTIKANTAEGNKSAACKVTVTAPVTGVKLDKTSVTLEKGKIVTLTATINPANATNKKVTWTSSNAKIAAVDTNGKVTAKAAGTATITVTTADGSKKATCKVTVKEIKPTPTSKPTPTTSPVPTKDPAACKTFGFCRYNGKEYWYENGVRQAVPGDPKNLIDEEYHVERGREIFDPVTGAWYWLDSVYDGAKAVGKEVWMPYIYQEEKNWINDAEKLNDIVEAVNSYSEDGGPLSNMGEQVRQMILSGKGKWVRYDENGKMMKGWVFIEPGTDLANIYKDQVGNRYFYDYTTGLMAKGWTTIAGTRYFFDETTGVLRQ